MLKYSIWIVLLLTISGIIFWREKASIQENVIIEQLDMNSKMDFNISYTLNTSGFPNRLDTAVKKLKIKKDVPSLVNLKQNLTEINGPKGLEPTRYGDWESKGRCSDF